MVIADVFVARMKGDTPVNSTMSVGQARKLVEQLKIEASFCRIKVRQAVFIVKIRLFIQFSGTVSTWFGFVTSHSLPN